MTNLTPLSPAAQAVLDAYWDGVPLETGLACSLAAALRAAADQDETLFDINDELVPAVRAVRTDHLLAIAAELEGAQ